MKKIFLSMGLIFFVLPYSYVYGMWYIVNPEDPNEVHKNGKRSNLLLRFMQQAALNASSLDAGKEIDRVEHYCNDHCQRGSKWTVACPDQKCESQVSSAQGLSTMIHSLKIHWYATHIHQPALYEQATGLVALSSDEAKQKYKDRKPFVVVPFPDTNAPVKAVAQTKQKAVVKALPLPAKEPEHPATHFLLERCVDQAGVFAAFLAHSQEEVLEAYLRSKMLEGQLNEFESVQQELFERTKKQRLVQGDTIRSLVCPAQGCKRQVTQSEQQVGEQVMQVLLVHYAAHHRGDHPYITRLVGLIAPSFLEARKNIETGEEYE